MDGVNDQELMERLAAGDLSALGPLHQTYARPVMTLMLRLDPSMGEETAEDLCQEVFLTLVDKAAGYRDEGKLKSFLYGIAVRKAKSRKRKFSWRKVLRFRGGEDAAGVSLQTARPDAQASARMEMDRALRSLSENHREILMLHIVEGLPGAEVAEILGISENAVWTRLHRARKALQEKL